MRIYRSIGVLLSIALICISIGAVRSLAQETTNTRLVAVPAGTTMELQGVVTVRNPDSFILRDLSGTERTVLMTSDTKVSSHHKAFKGKTAYPVTYILRGLRLETKGRGDANGNLVAEWVRFEEDDLESAQALKMTTDLAEENAARVAAAEENARRMAGQIEETNALANAAQASANAAQAQADAAFKAAAMANNRINGLDDFEMVRMVPVLFGVNKSTLSPEAKAAIDETAAWAKEQKAKGNANGWLVQVVGFADTTGNTAKNRALSERRAKTVITYLVDVHDLDLRRLVQPFGFGEGKPVASNATPAGRAQNRRVEIRILQNKGIANTIDKE